jgi:hypothetical protein
MLEKYFWIERLSWVHRESQFLLGLFVNTTKMIPLSDIPHDVGWGVSGTVRAPRAFTGQARHALKFRLNAPHLRPPHSSPDSSSTVVVVHLTTISSPRFDRLGLSYPTGLITSQNHGDGESFPIGQVSTSYFSVLGAHHSAPHRPQHQQHHDVWHASRLAAALAAQLLYILCILYTPSGTRTAM